MSLTPCSPLASLLAIAAQGGPAAAGVAYGLAFGLGAAVTPLVLVLLLISACGGRLRTNWMQAARWLRPAAGGVLILLGLYRLAGA